MVVIIFLDLVPRLPVPRATHNSGQPAVPPTLQEAGCRYHVRRDGVGGAVVAGVSVCVCLCLFICPYTWWRCVCVSFLGDSRYVIKHIPKWLAAGQANVCMYGCMYAFIYVCMDVCLCDVYGLFVWTCRRLHVDALTGQPDRVGTHATTRVRGCVRHSGLRSSPFFLSFFLHEIFPFCRDCDFIFFTSVSVEFFPQIYTIKPCSFAWSSKIGIFSPHHLIFPGLRRKSRGHGQGGWCY
jgi:hypothetical protein